MAASNSVETAKLSASGFVSCPRGLEGTQGFAETHAGEWKVAAFGGMGATFVFESVQHKFHACCHGTHAALEALIEARDGNALEPEDIEAIRITVNPFWRKVCNIAEPATGLQAKFSYRLTAVLVLLHHDTASLTTFSDAACSDPAVLELRDRVFVEFDDDIPDTAARIRLERRNGPPIAVEHDLAHPVPLAERQDRVRSKATSLLGEARAADLWAFVHEEDRLLSEWIAGKP